MTKKYSKIIGRSCILAERNRHSLGSLNPIGVVFYVECAISLVATSFSDNFLPEQFLRDSIYFEQRINSKITGYKDSFQVVVSLYGHLGITRASVGLRIIEWFIFFLALSQSRNLVKAHKNRAPVFFLSSFYLALLPFYGSLFTKEFLVILMINIYLIFKKILGTKFNFTLIVVFQLFIALILRKYYLITLSFMFFYKSTGNHLYKIRLIFPILLISMMATLDARTQIISQISKIEVFSIRNFTNENLKIVANSKITQSALSSNYFENLGTFLDVAKQVLFPVQLLSPSIYSIFTFLTVIIINLALCGNFLLVRKTGQETESVFLFAFFSTALIFEPDLGSYVRHGFVFLLFTILLITSNCTIFERAKFSHVKNKKNDIYLDREQNN